MLKRIMSILFVAGLFMSAAPAFAAEVVTTPPQITAVRSQRYDLAYAIRLERGQAVLQYGKGEETADRSHTVYVDNTDGTVTEEVVIGDTVYVRQNKDVRWKSGKLSTDTTPVTMPSDSTMQPTIYRVGDTEVNGVATTQYQFAIDPKGFSDDPEVTATLTSAAVDLFIGKNDGFLYKLEFTLRGTDKDLGAFTISILEVYSAFNQPVTIGAPPSNLVDPAPARTASKVTFPGLPHMPARAGLMIARSFQQLRTAR